MSRRKPSTFNTLETYLLQVEPEEWALFWDYDSGSLIGIAQGKRSHPYLDVLETYMQKRHPGLLLGGERQMKKLIDGGYVAFYCYCKYTNSDGTKCPEKFTINVRSKPKKGEAVQLSVTVKNQPRNHTTEVDICSNTREVKGSVRKQLIRMAANTSSSQFGRLHQEFHNSRYEGDEDDQISPIGRYVLKNIRSEAQRQNLYDANVLGDLQLWKTKYLLLDVKDSCVKGYVHNLERSPFSMSLYFNSQLEKTVKLAQAKNGLVCYFDATGSILTKNKSLPVEKEVLLYTLTCEGFREGTTLNIFMTHAHARFLH